MFKQLDDKSFKRTIRVIGSVSDKLQTLIHSAGIYALQQSFTGNPNPARDLIGAMNQSQRGEAMKKWLIHFGCLQWDNVTKAMKYRKVTDFGPEKFDAQINKADANPYYSFSKEIAATAFDFDLLQHIINNIKTAEKLLSGKTAGKYNKVVHAEKLDAIKRVLADDAAHDVAVESSNVVSIAEAMCKRADASELLAELCKQMGYDVEFNVPEQQQQAA